MRNPEAQQGFSMIELMLAMALLIGLLIGLRVALVTGRNASRQTTTNIRLDQDLRLVLGRISEELRSASRIAEDTNKNGTLDGDEDTNGNGRLDSDWSLSADSVTFNRLLADGTYSLPITFRRNGNTLEYSRMMDTAGNRVTTPLTRSVTDFSVAVDNSLVTVTLALAKDSVGKSVQTRSQSVSVRLRN